jgi:hypothetical protein
VGLMVSRMSAWFEGPRKSGTSEACAEPTAPSTLLPGKRVVTDLWPHLICGSLASPA